MVEKVDKNQTPLRAMIIFPLMIILAFMIFAFLSSRLPNFFLGEDFLLFNYGETHDYFEAIKLFFTQNGRLLEGIYWITFYKVIGYQPIIAHLFSLALNLVGIFLATIVLFAALPKRHLSRSTFLIFMLFVFFSPQVMNWSLALSGDNSRIAIILYFFSVYLLQRAVILNYRISLLICSFVVFVMACFAYENVSLLFPASILLTYPLILEKERTVHKKLIIGLFAIAFISLFIVLVPISVYQIVAKLYGPGFSHPAFAGEGFINELTERLRLSLGFLGRYLMDLDANLLILKQSGVEVARIIMASIVVFATSGILLLTGLNEWGKKQVSKFTRMEKNKLRSIYLAGLWITIMGVAPFAIGSHEPTPHVRYYSSAIFGISILITLSFYIFSNRLIKSVCAALCVIVVFYGFIEFDIFSNAFREAEFSPTNNYLALVEAVPAVKEGTSFVFIETQMGSSPWYGCSLPLIMLYDTHDIRCAFLSSTIEKYRATWSSEGLLANEGGLFNDENWILIGANKDGSRYVINEITPETNLLIDWMITKPIKTDYRRILSEQHITQMQQFLLNRRIEFQKNGE